MVAAGAALLVAGGALFAAALAAWGHLYRLMTGPELGFGFGDVAPCLFSTAGLCTYPLCGEPLFALAQHASDFFWAGIGLAGAGLFARSFVPECKTLLTDVVVSPEDDRDSKDMDILLAASCLPLPEAVIGLLAAQNSRNRDVDSVPADWSAFDSAMVIGVAVLGGAVALAALVTAAVS